MGAEFPASALSLVGNFNGACVIHLTGAAITIRRPSSIDIATWPYNCIRQFRADDDTGRFSFVSGRRGPYGVAEYIFELSDRQLANLQNALTQFTGAQFSHVIPGSDSINARPPSVSSSTGSRKSSGGRPDSVSSADSTFMSPVHRIPSLSAPRLPPRDYPLPGDAHSIRGRSAGESPKRSLPLSQSSITQLSHSHSIDMLSEARQRRSQTMSDGGYISSQTPPTRPAPQSSPLTKDSWVMKSQSYESTRQFMVDRSKLHNAGGNPAAKSRGQPASLHPGLDETPPTLPPRDYPLPMAKTSSFSDVKSAAVSRTTDDLQPPARLKKQFTEPAFATLPKSPPKRELSSKFRLTADSETARESNSDKVAPPPSSSSSSSSSSQKRSNYDRLEKLSETSSSEGVRERSKSFSPERSTPQAGTEAEREVFEPGSEGSDGCSSLDFLPRSSPQVQRRPITPEYAHHLRKFGDDDDVVINRSATVKGRRSPDARILSKINTAPSLYPHRVGGAAGGESDQTYNVPKSVLAEHNQSDSVYHVPRPQGGVVIDGQAYHVPRPQGELGPEGVYNVPRPSFTPRQPHHNYHMPIPSHETTPTGHAYYSQPSEDTDSGPSDPTATQDPSTKENLYNTPRSNGGNSTGENASDGLYNVPRRAGSLGNRGDVFNGVPQPSGQGYETENIYKVPRNKDGTRNSRDNQYEVINTDLPLPPPPPPSSDFAPLQRRIRPARSCESLATLRVRPPPPRAASISPPDMLPQTARHGNQYVDIDVDRNPAARQANVTTPPIDGDNLYAEIPENFPVRFNQSMHSRPLPPNQYSTLPPSGGAGSNFKDPPANIQRRPSPDSMSGHMLKARQLSREGYEICMPAGQDDVTNGNNQSTTASGQPYKFANPTPTRVIGTRHSISDVLETFHTQTAPSSAILGSSIPSDASSAFADEYVIVTRSDPSVRLASQPLTIPSSSSSPSPSSSSQPGGGAGSEVRARVAPPPTSHVGDEYELMNPAARAHIKPQPARYNTPDPSLYSTPNPSLYSTPNPTASSSAAFVGNSLAVPGTQVTAAPSNDSRLYGNVAHGNAESPNTNEYGNVRRQFSDELAGMSPVEDSLKSSSSSPSNQQEPEVEGQGSEVKIHLEPGEAPPVCDGGVERSSSTPIEIEKKHLVRIASGSPHDATVSLVFKNQTRSHGNVLDRTSPPSEAGGAPRKHTYVNVPKDSIGSSSGEPKQPPSPPPIGEKPRKKPPKPLPRSALLRANEQQTNEQQTSKGGGGGGGGGGGRKDHPYAMVELGKVKGNDNPLSSNEPDTPQ